MSTSSIMVKLIAKPLVTEKARMALVAGLVASRTQNEMSEAAEKSVIIAFPASLPSPDG